MLEGSETSAKYRRFDLKMDQKTADLPHQSGKRSKPAMHVH
jgi:hypothetical protein